MKILFGKLYEREGNDSWLVDRIRIVIDDGELELHHKINHTGWAGDVKENRIIELSLYDTVKSQKRVDEYLSNECLEDDFEIKLSEILDN